MKDIAKTTNYQTSRNQYITNDVTANFQTFFDWSTYIAVDLNSKWNDQFYLCIQSMSMIYIIHFCIQ